MAESLIPQLPDFDDPLGVLRACHQRMLAQCDTLEKLPAHIAAHGVDDQACSAINRLVTYFSSSAVHHHQDEEQDLFPLLDRQSPKLDDLVYRLKQDHEQLDQLWTTLLADLETPASLAGNVQFAQHASAFCAAYRAHIEIENQQLLDMARQILSSKQLHELGTAMARRRKKMGTDPI